MRATMNKPWKKGVMQIRLHLRTESGAVIDLAIPDANHREKRYAGLLMGIEEDKIEELIAEAEAKSPRSS